MKQRSERVEEMEKLLAEDEKQKEKRNRLLKEAIGQDLRRPPPRSSSSADQQKET